MHKLLAPMTLSMLALAGCGQGPAAASHAEKGAGPDPRSLNHDQLMTLFQECHAFGRIDDPRVKYSIEYCASVESVHASEGWTTPNTATVDPKLTPLH
jgi:hypothetical protein